MQYPPNNQPLSYSQQSSQQPNQMPPQSSQPKKNNTSFIVGLITIINNFYSPTTRPCSVRAGAFFLFSYS